MESKTHRIATLNDRLRRTFIGGRVMLTAGVANLPEFARAAILRGVQLHRSFNEDNDPWGEHDFGLVEVGKQRVYFKIDYYNEDMTEGSSDPSDESVTTRVITIMLPEEY